MSNTPISDQIRTQLEEYGRKLDSWHADLDQALDCLRHDVRSELRGLRADIRAARVDFDTRMDCLVADLASLKGR